MRDKSRKQNAAQAKPVDRSLPAQANPRQAQDQRWQRTVRFNWDKGGSQGGRK